VLTTEFKKDLRGENKKNCLPEWMAKKCTCPMIENRRLRGLPPAAFKATVATECCVTWTVILGTTEESHVPWAPNGGRAGARGPPVRARSQGLRLIRYPNSIQIPT